jgi:hypothetical protein
MGASCHRVFINPGAKRKKTRHKIKLARPQSRHNHTPNRQLPQQSVVRIEPPQRGFIRNFHKVVELIPPHILQLRAQGRRKFRRGLRRLLQLGREVHFNPLPHAPAAQHAAPGMKSRRGRGRQMPLTPQNVRTRQRRVPAQIHFHRRRKPPQNVPFRHRIKKRRLRQVHFHRHIRHPAFVPGLFQKANCCRISAECCAAERVNLYKGNRHLLIMNYPFFSAAFVLVSFCHAQQPQNPSPMVEHTRLHPRLEKPANELAGRHEKLTVGTLFIPAKLAGRHRLRLFVHFHGGSLVPELAAQKTGAAVISIQTGSGSGSYAKQFSDPALFGTIIKEASEKTGTTFDSITLTAWSAGHGAIREILSVPEYYTRVSKVILIDGLHTGYDGGKPGPLESRLEPDHLEIFLQFAEDAAAAAGHKTMLITHSEIFPGTFASTTETADWLLLKLQIPRHPRLKRGPMGTQQLSEASKGHFRLIGFAGNSAPDHVDQLHSLTEYLRRVR